MTEKEIKEEILKANYWEHFKYSKDLALILPLRHPKRIKIEKEINNLQQEINKLDDGK